MFDDQVVSVRVGGGQQLVGWRESTVSRSMERLAGSFSVPVSLVPGQAWPCQRGELVQVLLGSTVVATGYADVADPYYNKDDCGFIISGEDRTADLAVCSALHQGGKWSKASLERIALDLCRPFEIDVRVEADLGPVFAEYRIWFGETVLECISRAARMRGVLVCRNDAGQVVLTKAGATRAPVSICRGRNVIAMQPMGSDKHCHSEYRAYAQGAVGNTFDEGRQIKATTQDPDVRRYRPLIVPVYGHQTREDLQRLVEHTMRVRRGHARSYRYTVEGWLADGKPWPLNARVVVQDDIARVDGDDWIIAAVTERCDKQNGKVSDLTVTPLAAYSTVALKDGRHHGVAQGRIGRDGAPLEQIPPGRSGLGVEGSFQSGLMGGR